MALRLAEQIVRGEIDNRTQGCITGRIWLVDQADPVRLDLTGNAWRDLAGRLLTFTNPEPRRVGSATMAPLQKGVTGDCTASRKVKVPDVSEDELKRLLADCQPFPWHWGNCLYFEWFSEANGRVVLESANFQLTIVDGPTWEMSEDEEVRQRRANADAIMGFLHGFAAPSRDSAAHEPHDDAEPPPMTEAEAEALHAETERLSDRIQARIDRDGPDADIEKIITEELERRERERREPPLSAEDLARRAEWIEELTRAADAALSGTRDPRPPRHPLAARASSLSLRLFRTIEAHRWADETTTAEHPVVELVNRIDSAAAKLASALGGEWPPHLGTCAGNLVSLKRAREYLYDAQMAAVDCREQKLVDLDWLAGVETEITEIAASCDYLIAQLRRMLEPDAK